MSTWVVIFSLLGLCTARMPVGQNIILIQIDGLGATLLNQTKAESILGIREMMEKGAQAEHLVSVFPTQSWPTWMSLATGLYTENHGITADYMWDSKTGLSFNRGVSENDTYMFWRDRPAPLWYTAGTNHVDIHCYWFAHCHRAHYDMVVQVPSKRVLNINDHTQSDKMNEYFPEIINRINKYQGHKQQFFLLRFAGLEDAQRKYGKHSDQADQALTKIDLYIHELQNKLDEQDLFTSTNLIVYSDHGMAEVEDDNPSYLEECLSDFSKIKKVVSSHSVLMVFTENEEDQQTVHFELRVCDQWAPVGDYDEDEVPLVQVYKFSELPDELHWKGSRFMSGVVLITKPGKTIVTRELPSVPLPSEVARDIKMASGWPAEHADMNGIFVARGPAFKIAEKGGPLHLVDIYAGLLNILGLEPAHPHNGTWDNIGQLMTDGWEDRPHANPQNSVSLPTLSILSIILFNLLF